MVLYKMAQVEKYVKVNTGLRKFRDINMLARAGKLLIFHVIKVIKIFKETVLAFIDGTYVIETTKKEFEGMKKMPVWNKNVKKKG